MKTVEEIDFAKLKAMVGIVNTLPMIKGTEMEVKIFGKKKEAVVLNFKKAVQSVKPEDEHLLTEDVILFFNDCFSKKATEAPAPAADATAEAPVADTDKAPEAAAAEKKKAPKDPKKVEAANKMRKAKDEKSQNAARSCFGHKLGTQSAILDELINEGKYTLDELVEKSGRDKMGVKGHIVHLIKDRAINVEKVGEIYKVKK